MKYWYKYCAKEMWGFFLNLMDAFKLYGKLCEKNKNNAKKKKEKKANNRLTVSI